MVTTIIYGTPFRALGCERNVICTMEIIERRGGVKVGRTVVDNLGDV